MGFSPRTNDESNEIVGGMLFDGDVDFASPFATKEGGGDGVGGGGVGELEDLFEGILSLGGVAFFPPNGTGIFSFSVGSID